MYIVLCIWYGLIIKGHVKMSHNGSEEAGLASSHQQFLGHTQEIVNEFELRLVENFRSKEENKCYVGPDQVT